MKNQVKKLILITRPLEESRLFARKLRHEGFEVMVEPMLEIALLDFKLPDFSEYQGLIFTSVNGVRAMAARLGKKISDIECACYCVGDRTAREARAQGFDKALSAKGTASDLVNYVEKKITDKTRPLLYVRGEHTAQPIEKILGGMGFHIDCVIVYKAKVVTKLSPECIAAIKEGHIGAVTFFSKRTVETFLREVKKNGLLKEFFAIKLLSLSDSMLECVRPYRRARTHTARTPDGPGMLQLLRKLYGKDRK